ncbi:MAG: PQQ-dependent dehydrogenase, methanol/ethanol family, partial [Acidobacteria bacterium]
MNTRRILGLALVVVAMGVAIVLRSAADSAAKPGDVNEARVLSDAATGNNWLLNGRTFDAGHFSPLQQITDKNIGGLGLAWFLDIDGAMGVVSEPIVVDGVIYLSAPLSKVYAVDAATGKLLWKF